MSGQVVEDGNLELLERIDMRRKVMVHLCMMCEKGGDTITAIAMEELPAGPSYWVASNGHHNEIELFLSNILRSLEQRALSGALETVSEAFEPEIFGIFNSFQRTRVKQYWKLLQRCLESVLKVSLALDASGDYVGYIVWLQSFIQCTREEQLVARLAQLAYNMTHSPWPRVGYDPISKHPTAVESQFRMDVRHYIGRLSAYRRAAHLLTFAAASQPNLFIGFTTQQRRSDAIPWRPGMSSPPTLDGITRRMLSETRSSSTPGQSNIVHTPWARLVLQQKLATTSPC